MAEAAGFRVVAAVAAVSEHSIVHRYAQGRPDKEDTVRLMEYGKEIKRIIDEKEPSAHLNLPGNRPYKKASSLAIIPQSTSGCTSCGICAEQCPTQAIHPAKPAQVDKSRCISCMHCISVCPHSARRVHPIIVWLASCMLKTECSKRKSPELFL